MEKIKLWNWYGESYEKKINDKKYSYKDFINQSKNVYDRKKRNLDLKKKIDKNLFLKARLNLKNEEKRALTTLKISHRNESQILKETIKQLKIAKDLKSLIKFEIKKIDKKNIESANYVHNYYKMLLKTADDVSIKEQNIQSVLEKAKSDENILLMHKAFLIIIYQYIKITNNKERFSKKSVFENIDKFTSEQQIILNDDANIKKIKELYKVLINKQSKLFIKKSEIENQLPTIKKESKEKFKKEKKELKIDYQKRILQAEYSYNEEYQTKILDAKSELKERKLKIKAKKVELIEANKEKNLKLQQYYAGKKLQEKQIKQEYKQEIKIVKDLFKINKQYQKALIIANFLKLNAKKHLKDVYEKYHLSLVDFHTKNKENEIVFNKNKSHFQDVINKVESTIKNIKIEDKKRLEIHLENHLPFIYRKSKYKNALLYVKANYYKKLGQLKQEYSYDGDFLIKKSDALFEYLSDWNKQLNKFNYESRNAKLKILEIDSNPLQENKERLENKFLSIKTEYQENVNNLKSKLKANEITKKAYSFKLKELKINYKEDINSLKLFDEKEKNKSILKTQFIRLNSKRKIVKKIYESKVTEVVKQIPTENKNGAKWKAMFLNLLFPGLAQLFIFKEYRKAILYLILSTLFYAVFVPFSFGITWNKIGGIQGIIDLGKSIHNFEKGILPDARFWMFGAAASFILLAVTLAFIISSAVGAYRQGKFLEEGMRPQTWSQTKKWLSEQGFPWLISIPGWFLIAFIVLVPLITSLLISFSNTGFQHTPPGQTVDWIGFGQYGKWWIFRNNGLLTSISRVVGWTLMWTFLSGLSVIIVGTLFAILVNSEKIKFKKFFRLIYIIPWAIPAFVTIIFLKSAFQADSSSLINYILIKLNIIDSGINFFASTSWVRFLLIVIQTWLGHSYIFLLITGNLQSIPKDIYEAGEIDGARKSKLFWHITLPILLSSLAPLLIGQFTFMFNNFTIISLFSGGGPAYLNPTAFQEASTDIIISWIYKLTTAVQIDGNVAFSSALVILASLISVSFAAYGFAKSLAKGGK
ncbi:ABC transporter permease subunit [Mesomycoplasma lagogenitalium]|uniref:ABC transporter permease subunit n=1 Tax=Mesomycoplasma lagogenitalium TaxID=171286 RepID=A0ABY8LWW3_9BACT|nr:ABC transporter permease subunit [Mesomycoplasma lagogenitalium]WGI36746.1 ABC transporter permease subunit [Mesomycoplasma lagogenitalium]